ncbi:MAG: hypothetical protein AAF467_05470 [Actinomycetota bacterium]
MSGKGKWIGVIVLGTVIAMLFSAPGPLGGFWGMESGETDPAGGALAALIGAAIVEWIAFGIGLAWLAFGWPVVRRTDVPLALPAWAAIGWGLVSWAPHTSFHQSVAEGNYGGLAAVEWAFHVTLVIGACIVAAFTWQVLRSTTSGAGRTPSSPAAAAIS